MGKPRGDERLHVGGRYADLLLQFPLFTCSLRRPIIDIISSILAYTIRAVRMISKDSTVTSMWSFIS